MTTESDHLEANGTDTTSIQVHAADSGGNPISGLAINLSTTLGTLQDTTMITDAYGIGAVDSNGNGAIEDSEPRYTTLTAGTRGGFAQVTAATMQGYGYKSIVMHQVQVTDFSQPKLLLYDPDATGSLSAPQMTFTVGDKPAITATFNVVMTIYTLHGHDPIAIISETLAPGTYTRPWSAFFYQPGDNNPGWRTADPGAGIYPFQITATVNTVNTAALIGITTKSCAHADWKSSQSLVIDWTNSSVYYDEIQSKTMLGYAFQIRNTQRAVAPAEVHLDVYNPEFQVVQTIPVTLQPDATYPNMFFGTAAVPITITEAGDYHFVVEAHQKDELGEGKDRNKWALEQNGMKQFPTFALFGGYEPAVGVLANAFGGNANNSPASSDFSSNAQLAAQHLTKCGYVANPPPAKWWKQDHSGFTNSDGLTYEDMIGHPASAFNPLPTNLASLLKQQPMQYTAVWASWGHGFGGDLMAHWAAPEGDSVDTTGEVEGKDDERLSWLVPNAAAERKYTAQGIKGTLTILDELPKANSFQNGAWYLNQPPLIHLRLAAFLSCESASTTIPDLPGTAVRLGAKSAIGIVNPVNPTDLGVWSQDLFYYLAAGRYLDVAAKWANQRLGSSIPYPTFGIDYRIRGDTKIVLTDGALLQSKWTYYKNPHWGDDKGPDAAP